MIYILIPLLIIIALIIYSHREKVSKKLKLFFKNYKILIILEIAFLVVIYLINIFDKSILVKEIDPHYYRKFLGYENYSVKAQYALTEGDIYEYTTVQYNNIEDIKNLKMQELKKNFKIEKINNNNVVISKDGKIEEYKYGTGFSYYGLASCMCGTPIRFEKRFEELTKLVVLISIMVDIIIICFIKEDNSKGESKDVRID